MTGHTLIHTLIPGHPSVADEAWYWLKCILCSGWLCTSSRPRFFILKKVQSSLIVHTHYPIILVILFRDWIHHHSCSYILISISQVNASPSLSHTTPSDRVMKTSLINDIINIVLSPSGFPEYASMNSHNKEMQWHRQDTEGSRGSVTREHKEVPH